MLRTDEIWQLFQLNAVTQTLTGRFEFTRSSGLASSFFGDLIGSCVDADILNRGGQFSIDCSVTGGSGAFTGATGFGLAFDDFNPTAVFDNHAEARLLTLTLPCAVPEPATWALAAMGLWAWRWRSDADRHAANA